MKPMTPRGTGTRAISRPLGRRQASTVSPTGSGSAAISRRPAAIVSMRASVSVRRSRNARGWPAARARSRSARLASRMAAVFSSSPRAICSSASFLVRLPHSARARAASRAARALVSTSVLTSIWEALSLQYDQIVAVDHFFETLVAEARFDLARLGAADLAELGRVEVDQAAGELATLRLVAHRHHLARREVPLDPDDARRQQALAPQS